MTEGNSTSTNKADAAANRETRRALLKAAAMAMPLIVTLRGKPANAQDASLGSLGIAYGPMAYVSPNDIKPTKEGGQGWDPSWLGEAKNENNQILLDKTRRTKGVVSDPTQPKNP